MRLSVALSVAVLCGCSEPVYEPIVEAGPNPCPSDASCAIEREAGHASELDGGASRDAEDARALDPSDALRGKYAVHTRFYGRELALGFITSEHETFLLVDITREPDGKLQAHIETCGDSGRLVTDPVATELWLPSPEFHPVRVVDVNYDNGTFFTSGPGTPIGYDLEPPPSCVPGQMIAASSAQREWLPSGMCTCPAKDAPPPTLPEDCRVTDPDGDRWPGFTIQSRGVIGGPQALRIFDSSHFVQGEIDPTHRRHRAKVDKKEQILGLKCTGQCWSLDARMCSIEHQLVTFEPLGTPGADLDIDCPKLMRRVDDNELFAGEELVFPQGC